MRQAKRLLQGIRWLWRRRLLLVALGAAGIVTFPFLWREWVHARYGRAIYEVNEAPEAEVAIVFGAAVYRGGRLSPMLRDRVETAVRLYHEGKVERLLFSGDNREEDYDEPGQMTAYAVRRGVPASAIQQDGAGLRTYDTCYRARHVFGVEGAVLVTQSFHLPRALFTCRQLGVDVLGVSADRRVYHPRSLAWLENRELAALLLALVDVVRERPATVMGRV